MLEAVVQQRPLESRRRNAVFTQPEPPVAEPEDDWDTDRYLEELRKFKKLHKKVKPATPIRNICNINKNLSKKNAKDRWQQELNEIQGNNRQTQDCDLFAHLIRHQDKMQLNIPETLYKDKDVVTMLYTDIRGYVKRQQGRDIVDLFFNRVKRIFNKQGSKLRHNCPMFLHKSTKTESIAIIETAQTAEEIWATWPHSHQMLQRYVIPRSTKASVLRVNFATGKKLSYAILTNKKSINTDPKPAYDYPSRPATAKSKIKRDPAMSVYVHDIDNFPYAGNLLKRSFHILDAPNLPQITNSTRWIRPQSAMVKSNTTNTLKNKMTPKIEYTGWNTLLPIANNKPDMVQKKGMTPLFLGIYASIRGSLNDEEDRYNILRKHDPNHESMYLVKAKTSDSVSFAKVKRPIVEVECQAKRLIRFLRKIYTKRQTFINANFTFIQEKSGKWHCWKVSSISTPIDIFKPAAQANIFEAKKQDYMGKIQKIGLFSLVQQFHDQQVEQDVVSKQVTEFARKHKVVERAVSNMLPDNKNVAFIHDRSKPHQKKTPQKPFIRSTQSFSTLADISGALDTIKPTRTAFIDPDDLVTNAEQFYKKQATTQKSRFINTDKESELNFTSEAVLPEEADHKEILQNLSYGGDNKEFHPRKYNTCIYDDYNKTLDQFDNLKQRIMIRKNLPSRMFKRRNTRARDIELSGESESLNGSDSGQEEDDSLETEEVDVTEEEKEDEKSPEIALKSLVLKF